MFSPTVSHHDCTMQNLRPDDLIELNMDTDCADVDCSNDDEYVNRHEADGELRCYQDTFHVGNYNESTCSICLELYTMDNPAFILSCGHSLHVQCVESWMQRSNLCPVCYQALRIEEGHLMSSTDARRRRRYCKSSSSLASTTAPPAMQLTKMSMFWMYVICRNTTFGARAEMF